MPKEPKELLKKRLSKTDIAYRMAIPMESLWAFQLQGEHSKEFDVFDIDGNVWKLRCSTRKTDPYPKPVLSSGWIKYVKAKGLKEDDEVSFYERDKDGVKGLQFGIQARKQIKLMGKQVWGNPL